MFHHLASPAELPDHSSLISRRCTNDRLSIDDPRLRLGSLYYEPQHERHFPEHSGLGVEKHVAVILRPHYAGKAHDYVRYAIDDQPHSQKTRQEARFVNKHR